MSQEETFELKNRNTGILFIVITVRFLRNRHLGQRLYQNHKTNNMSYPVALAYGTKVTLSNNLKYV